MSDMSADIRERLSKKNIHELRQIARAVGVSRPADAKRERLLDEIMQIASAELKPSPRTTRGAPPKSSDYDRAIVEDIKKCASVMASSKNGTGVVETDPSNLNTCERPCRGIIRRGDTFMFMRVNGCLPSEEDVYVYDSFITRFALEEGDFVEGICRPGRDGVAPGLVSISGINGCTPDALERKKFSSLTPVYPHKKIKLDGGNRYLCRMADLFAPVGRGQRAVVETPSNIPAAVAIKEIAAGISQNEPDLKTAVLLLSERPEDVTDIRRSLSNAEVFSTPFCAPPDKLEEAAAAVVAYMERTAECGKDSVLLVSGLSKLGRDAARQALACAQCTEEGPSLTIIAFECLCAPQFQADANCYIKISGDLISPGSFPQVAPDSYTLHAELLQSAEELSCAYNLKTNHGGDGDFLARLFMENSYQAILEKYKNGR